MIMTMLLKEAAVAWSRTTLMVSALGWELLPGTCLIAFQFMKPWCGGGVFAVVVCVVCFGGEAGQQAGERSKAGRVFVHKRHVLVSSKAPGVGNKLRKISAKSAQNPKR